jgi:polysaccharide export outer membrane protein
MRPGRLLPLSLISILLGACSLLPPWFAGTPTPTSSSNKSSANIAERQTLSTPRAGGIELNGAYRLDTGDRVRVLVAGQDALSNSYELDAGGAIEIVSIGRVLARGLNTIQLSGVIERRLKQNKLRKAHVAVQIETYRPFTIRGEVANPGQYPYVNNMTTETAIAIAGGLKPRANKDAVTVSSDGQDGARAPSALTSPVQPGEVVTVTEER